MSWCYGFLNLSLIFTALILSGGWAIYIKPEYYKDAWTVGADDTQKQADYDARPDPVYRREEVPSLTPLDDAPPMGEAPPPNNKYCGWSTPCQWTVCPWTIRLWKFGVSSRCYTVPSGCECGPHHTCNMEPFVDHGSSKNTATWYCRRPTYRPRYKLVNPPNYNSLFRRHFNVNYYRK